ncbi:MAG: hypothetical protein COA79_20750 [Planctomycetota bacterium]|nr:MAG: hypothetical protein COA79_20750 [Planctomycetota bacterium]
MKNEPIKDSSENIENIFGYKVEGFLGEGGMNKVYRVRDKDFDRVLALKVSKDISPSSMVRFVLEGKITGQLQHPLIAPVYSLSAEKGKSCYYTMKRIRGLTLKEVLLGRANKDPHICKKYSRRQLLIIFISLCQAMSYAHNRGVIHRDIKPENIMLGNYGEVYLIDWGLAKTFGRNLYTDVDTKEEVLHDDDASLPNTDSLEDQIAQSLQISDEELEAMAMEQTTDTSSKELTSIAMDETIAAISDMKVTNDKNIKSEEIDDNTIISNIESSSGNTQQGTIFGTPLYMAPEQASGNVEDHDHRSDLYSLGVVLWEILLEKPMRIEFARGNKEDFLLKISTGQRPKLISMTQAHRLEPDLRAILLKATRASQDQRYQSGDEMFEDLQNFLDGKRKWKLVHEEDFSEMPDQDDTPEGWNAWVGSWGIRDGALAPIYDRDTIIHLNKDIVGDVRMEINAFVLEGGHGEISPILAAPKVPKKRYFDDGYCFEFGANNMVHTKITRDGVEFAYAPSEAPVPGVNYHLTVELLEGRVRIEANGKEIINQRDLFAIAGQRVGFYSWTKAIRIKSIRIYSAGAPMEISYLAVPNQLMKLNYWERALKEYRRYYESQIGSVESDEALYKSILCLLELKRYDESIPLIKRLKDTPMESLAWVAESILYEKQNNPVEEANVLSRSLNHINKSFESWEDLLLRIQVRARELFDHLELDCVIKLQQALIDAKWLELYIRGNAVLDIYYTFELKGDYFKALVQIDSILEEFEHGSLKSRIQLLRANVHLILCQFKNAFAIYQECLQEYKGAKTYCIDVDKSIGNVYKYQGQSSEAREHWIKCIKEYSDLPRDCADMLFYISATYITERNYSKAKEYYFKIKTDYPMMEYDEQFNRDIGIVNFLEEKFEEARKYFRKLPFASRYASHGYLMRSYLEQDRCEDAKEYIEEVISKHSGNHKLQSLLIGQLARIHKYAGDIDLAQLKLDQILKKFPDQRTACLFAYFSKAKIEINLGNYTQALKLFHEIKIKFPELYGDLEMLWVRLLEYSLDKNKINISKEIPLNSRFGYNRYSWGICLRGNPGEWLTDERACLVTPYEAMRRTSIDGCIQLQNMIDFRATLDDAWKPYSSDIKGPFKLKEMRNQFEIMPKD